MLAPALLLVVIMLGGIAIDLSLVHTARRSAYRSLSAAADDAAAMIDAHEYQVSGTVQLDPEAAERVVRAHLGLLEENGPDGFAAPAFEVTSADVHADVEQGTVEIDASITVERILLSAVPGMDSSTQLEMHVTGRML